MKRKGLVFFILHPLSFILPRGCHMNLLQAVVLGVVQGLTEFLPISSTAHLRIVPALLDWPDPGAGFSAVIQIGTLVAVFAYFWRDLVRIVPATLGSMASRKLDSPDARLGWLIATVGRRGCHGCVGCGAGLPPWPSPARARLCS